MIWVRKAFVHLFAIVLFVSILGGVAVFNINRSLGQPDSVKQLLVKGGFYDNTVSSALDYAQKQDKNATVGEISLSSVAAQQAANKAFTDDVIQGNVNKFIDGNFAWLKGQTATPQFKIDLTQPKQDFADIIGQYVQTRLTSLPVCTPAQLTSIALPVDPLSVTCRPQTVDAKTEGKAAAQQVANSDFLTKPVITANSLGRDESSSSKPYYEQLSKAPQVYRLSQKLPIIAGVVAVVCLLFIILIAPTKRRGFRRIAFVFLLSGLLLVISSFVTSQIREHAIDKIHGSAANQFSQQRDSVATELLKEFGQIDLIAGGVLVLLALAVYAWLLTHKPEMVHPAEQPIEPKQLDKPDEKDDIAEATALPEIKEGTEPIKQKKPQPKIEEPEEDDEDEVFVPVVKPTTNKPVQLTSRINQPAMDIMRPRQQPTSKLMLPKKPEVSPAPIKEGHPKKQPMRRRPRLIQ